MIINNKKRIMLLLAIISIIHSCAFSKISDSIIINNVLNKWHLAATNADAKTYFSLMADDAIFIGTDATEHWNKIAFETFAMPYFEKGKAWSFNVLERHLYSSNNKSIVWFDELLQTSMKICRGSGVLEKINKKWIIKHYVLSMTIPNEQTKNVIILKAKIEDSLMRLLQHNEIKNN